MGRPGKGDLISKAKKKAIGKKRPTTKKANGSRSKTVKGHRQRPKNIDANVDSFSDIDIDVDKTLSTVFSSLHNIQNQIGFKRQDELALNMAKLKQVRDTHGHTLGGARTT